MLALACASAVQKPNIDPDSPLCGLSSLPPRRKEEKRDPGNEAGLVTTDNAPQSTWNQILEPCLEPCLEPDLDSGNVLGLVLQTLCSGEVCIHLYYTLRSPHICLQTTFHFRTRTSEKAVLVCKVFIRSFLQVLR